MSSMLSPGGWESRPNPGSSTSSASTEDYTSMTNGCIAMSNKDMDVIWESVAAGTAIVIKP